MQVYHITEKSNLYGENGIIKNGLIPQCGERSKKIKDYREVVCFTNNYYTLPTWSIYLYPNLDYDNLCVLTFDIPESEAIPTENDTEFATEHQILPENISIATFIDKDTKENIPFFFLQEGKKKYTIVNCERVGTEIEIEVITQPLSKIKEIIKKEEQQDKILSHCEYKLNKEQLNKIREYFKFNLTKEELNEVYENVTKRSINY